jgi:hypothetical protein
LPRARHIYITGLFSHSRTWQRVVRLRPKHLLTVSSVIFKLFLSRIRIVCLGLSIPVPHGSGMETRAGSQIREWKRGLALKIDDPFIFSSFQRQTRQFSVRQYCKLYPIHEGCMNSCTCTHSIPLSLPYTSPYKERRAKLRIHSSPVEEVPLVTLEWKE